MTKSLCIETRDREGRVFLRVKDGCVEISLGPIPMSLTVTEGGEVVIEFSVASPHPLPVRLQVSRLT